MQEYRLRPHHGLCIAFFRGNGYSQDFTQNMTDIISRLTSEDPQISLTSGVDIICASCPHNIDGRCDSGEKVAAYDKAVMDACGLCIDVNLSWDSFRNLVRQKIIDPGKRRNICGSCHWDALCSSIEGEK